MLVILLLLPTPAGADEPVLPNPVDETMARCHALTQNLPTTRCAVPAPAIAIQSLLQSAGNLAGVVNDGRTCTTLPDPWGGPVINLACAWAGATHETKDSRCPDAMNVLRQASADQCVRYSEAGSGSGLGGGKVVTRGHEARECTYGAGSGCSHPKIWSPWIPLPDDAGPTDTCFDVTTSTADHTAGIIHDRARTFC